MFINIHCHNGNGKDKLASSYKVNMVMWLKGGEKGGVASFVYMPAVRMWLYVLYDNKANKKKKLH